MSLFQQQLQNAKHIETEPGVVIGYEEFGSGDKYIISMHQNHAPNIYIPRFAEHGYHVFHLWNRGAGASSIPAGADYGTDWYNKFAYDVVTFADKMGIDKFVYTGGSHGSGTGWHLCWKYPERLKAFISVVCGPQLIENDPICFRDIIKANPNFDFYDDGNRDPALMKRRAVNDAYNKESKQHEVPANYHRPFCQLEKEEKVDEVLKSITVPTLLVGGLKDQIIPPELMFRTAKLMPNAKLLMYSVMGHVGPMTEYVEEVMSEYLHFLKSVEENDGRIYERVIED